MATAMDIYEQTLDVAVERFNKHREAWKKLRSSLDDPNSYTTDDFVKTWARYAKLVIDDYDAVVDAWRPSTGRRRADGIPTIVCVTDEESAQADGEGPVSLPERARVMPTPLAGRPDDVPADQVRVYLERGLMKVTVRSLKGKKAKPENRYPAGEYNGSVFYYLTGTPKPALAAHVKLVILPAEKARPQGLAPPAKERFQS